MWKGIDVSYAQGYINWNVMKDNVDFAILRCGRGKYGTGENTPKTDDRFLANQKGCEVNNIPYGVYFFSYATSYEWALKEAKYCLSLIKGHKLGYPVYFDFEYDSADHYKKVNNIAVSPEFVCKATEIFCEELHKGGYYSAVYTNPDYIARYYGEQFFHKYDLWLADWRANGNKIGARMWQTGAGKVGTLSRVDTDNCYFDYPAYMEKGHINGYPAKNLLPLHDIALEVIEGKWGAGEIRKKKLEEAGYNYREVQNEVNKILWR